jgi:regulatory protein
MKIERVVKKDDENIIVYLDNKEKLYLSYEVFLKNRLKKDMEISEDGFSFLVKENQKYYIQKKAFDYIGRRLHSYNELKLKLLKKQYDKELVSKVLNYLKEKNYLNDYEFGKQYVEEKIRTKSWGKNKLKSELYKKGIALNIIQQILEEEKDESSLEKATVLAEKKLSLLLRRKYEKRTLTNKLSSFLFSRGYEYDIIREVLNKLFEDK